MPHKNKRDRRDWKIGYIKRFLARGLCPNHNTRKIEKGHTRCLNCLYEVRIRNLRQVGVPSSELERAAQALQDFDGHCQICRRFTRHRFCMDHDHATKRFRGILCTPCNNYLAFIKDNPEVAKRMGQYLR